MVEKKVTASTAAAVTTGVVLWVLQTYVFGGGDVPGPLAAFVGLVVLGGVTFGVGYMARHSPRPDLDLPPNQAPRHRAAADEVDGS